MNLLEIRTKLINESGRFDLVTDPSTSDYSDAGANFHITAGQKYLDRKAEVDKQTARVFKMISAGDYYVTFQYCRVIQEVWVANTTNRLQLKKVDMNKLRGTDYPSQENAYVNPFTETTQARPLYYAPAILKAAPEQSREGFDITDGYNGYMDIMIGDTSNYNGIVFMTPADQAYMVEVVGKFLSAELTSDTHENYWTIEHPEILVMAAMRSIEIFNRNTEGTKDWTNAITEALYDIERDVVDEESLGYDVMEG